MSDNVVVDVRPTVQSELQAVAAMLAARFPDRDRADLEDLVADVYQRLSGDARIRTHLIPLTLNSCRRVLSAQHSTVPPVLHQRKARGPK